MQYAGASAVQLLATGLSVPLLTRALPLSEFGRVATAIIVLQLTWILCSWGLPSAITRQELLGKHDPSGPSRLIGCSILFSTATAGTIMTTAPLWAPVIGMTGVGTGLAVAVAAGASLSVVNAMQALLRARGQAGQFLVNVAISAGLGNLVGVAACHLVAQPTHVTFLLGLLAGNLAALGTVLVRIRPALPRWSDRGVVRTLALPTLPHMVGIYLISSQDRLVIANTLGDDQVGRYQVAYFVGSLTMLGLQAVNNAWAPAIIGASDEERTALLLRTTRVISYLVVGGLLFCALTMPWLLRIASPSHYLTSDLPVAAILVSLSSVPALVYLAHSHLLFVVGDLRVFAFAAPLGCAVGLGVSYALIDPLGLLGPAIGSLVAQSTLALLVVVAARRKVHVRGLLGRAWPALGAAVSIGAATSLWGLTR